MASKRHPYHMAARHGRMKKTKHTPMPAKQFFSIPNIITAACLVLIAGFSTYLALHYFQKRTDYFAGKNIVYNIGEVLGIQSETATVSVDFSRSDRNFPIGH